MCDTTEMNISTFRDDLSKESFLAAYLDKEVYPKLSKNLNLTFTRPTSYDEQTRGIDLYIDYKGRRFVVDEKAQLDYLNTTLPTFAFELSFNNSFELRKGWLFDFDKLTTHYFLITGIYVNDSQSIFSGIKRLKITSVDRTRLQDLLFSKGLTETRLQELRLQFLSAGKQDKIEISELKPKSEGYCFISAQKAERPFNLVMKLAYLIESGVAKSIYP